MKARGCECESEDALRHQARQPSRHHPRAHSRPPQVLWVRFNASALLARLGARLAALRTSGTFSPLPTKVLSEAGGDVARLLLSPSVQRDVLPGGTIIQDWQPYQPSESNLRLLAAKDIEWLLDSRARPRVLTLCTRPFPIPHGGDCT